MFITSVLNQAKTLLPFKDEKGSRGATLIKPIQTRLHSLGGTGDWPIPCVDNGTHPAGATVSSPAQLPGPFEVGVCTAFAPPGGSLKHRFNLYFSRSTFFCGIQLQNNITGFFAAVKHFDDI
jgi:hypothetical protein